MTWSMNATLFGALVFVVWRTVLDKEGKPEQKACAVVDFRGLNEVSEKDSFPLPGSRI